MNISVVIPAVNDENFLGKTLASLKKQHYSKKYELIVVDNGSWDQTAQIAKKFGAKVVFESKKGEVYARETGFRAAQGDIIATTDADTTVDPNWLVAIEREFKKDQELVAISGWLRLSHRNPLFRLGAFFYNLFNFLQFSLFGLSFFTACNMACRRSKFLAIGGFRPKSLFATEADFFERVKKTGKVKYVFDMTADYNLRTFEKYGYLKVWWPYVRGWFSYNFLGGRFSPVIRYYTREVKFQVGDIPIKKWALAKFFIVLFVLSLLPLYFTARKSAVLADELDVKVLRAKIVYQTKQLKETAPALIEKVNNFDFSLAR